LLLNEKKGTKLRENMVFNLCVGFSNLDNKEKENDADGKAKKFAILLADTIIITKDEPEIITNCSRR
jgi:nucleosome binding factor SPN SPT16 subunit